MEKPLYEIIYEKLKSDIISGIYKSGEKIPSEKELSEMWKVSRITPKKSLEKLVSEGLVVRHAGRGSFVAEITDDIFSGDINSNKQNKPNLIGFVIPNLDSNYGTDLLNSIEEEAENNNSHIVVKRSLGDPEKEKEAIKKLIEIGVTGIIIFPAQAEQYNEEILKLVINNFPIVLVDRYLKGVPAVSISSDNFMAAKNATEYLFRLGHDNICLLSSPHYDTTALEERYEGFIEAHVKNNITIDKSKLMSDISFPLIDYYTKGDIEKDIRNIRKHLEENPQLTALFATEYRIALLAENAVAQMGLKIPNDISILCFDYTRETVEKDKFTYIKQDQELMGKMAVQSVFDMLKGQDQKKETVKLPGEIVEGKSTRRINQ
ncbi:LacI family transcriptional regulator [Thalassobacillus devorans]|uniref:LacI family transcriptional regulator n=1 Tax=Thalassobacillus devorans TaxID=279813 RepID=A0ABQ1NKD3_9BACI|nr:GntR family transcriptional regulator [Thalassobacillus devorans]NIK27253.1 DNA-binding LacI/PurR family transcriptional regulator [Thalassobacillus devorans]GGC76187.1 LacI family transcriptional regulator [Thalassobacillus devorans]